MLNVYKGKCEFNPKVYQETRSKIRNCDLLRFKKRELQKKRK